MFKQIEILKKQENWGIKNSVNVDKYDDKCNAKLLIMIVYKKKGGCWGRNRKMFEKFFVGDIVTMVNVVYYASGRYHHVY